MASLDHLLDFLYQCFPLDRLLCLYPKLLELLAESYPKAYLDYLIHHSAIAFIEHQI
jgi:hypothetical protein